jgi:hypothetical protein
MSTKTPPMVLIEWEDSTQAAPEWQWAKSLQTPPALRCTSIGFLVGNGKRQKSLAISVANDASQVSGIISIPTRCITGIRKLKATSAS